MKFYTLNEDKVIGGFVVSAATDYDFALKHFVPLIGRLEIQRDALKTKFYSRLHDDIIRGCVMPPITIALIHTFPKAHQSQQRVFGFISTCIADAFVLDGIQRLSTLQRAALNSKFDRKRPLHVNFVIAGSRDKLLYRMITLNNGQKPMSARHQIDVLADSFFSFDDVELKLVSEKGKGRVRAPDTFKKADFVKGYVAYLSGSVNVDNQKIIEEKMDELIASKIIESDIPTSKVEFADVVELVTKFSKSDLLREWIRVQNNFIGFCVGARRSVSAIKAASLNDLEAAITNFDEAMKSIDVSKVNLGRVRRECVAKFVETFHKVVYFDVHKMLDMISNWI